jgi:ABC-type sugar transport system ATPase subunit
VFEVADRLAVLYLGRMVATGPASEFDPAITVDMMTMGATSRTVGSSMPVAGPIPSDGVD